jgi:glyoxylase-like metal-dependent hydrolase (beta-lactamase superfamily II)
MYMKTLTIAAALLIGGCASGPPEIQLLNDAAEALGGRDRILAIQTLTVEGEGTSGSLGQNLGADGAIHLNSILGHKLEIDVAQQRMSEQYSSKRQFTFVLPEFTGPVHSVIDGDVAYNVGADGTARPAGNAAAQQIEMLRHPITIIRAALEEGATIGPLREDGDVDVVDITTAKGHEITLAVDRDTKLPQSVSTMTFNGILGDVAVITSFLDYEDLDGVMLPKRLRTVVDETYEFLQREIEVAANTLDADLSHLAAPESVTTAEPGGGGGFGGFPAGFGSPSAGPPVVVTELAKGIYHLGGQEASGGFQYNQILVEFEDHTELIGPNQNEARILAAIEKARETVPDKPLTKAIVTHSHSDHAGGVRAAVAEGLALVVHESTVDYFDDIIRRPFAGNPDHLAKNPVEPKPTEGVGDHLRVQDSMQTMDIYHFPGNAHADHMLYFYFPEHDIAVDADMYNMDPGPGRPAPDIWPASVKTGVIPGFNLVWIDDFFAELERRNLPVKIHVPIHGVVVSHERLAAYRALWTEDGLTRLEDVK